MQQESYAEKRERRQCQQPIPRLLSSRVFSQKLGMVFALERESLHFSFDLPRYAPEVSPLDVTADVDAARGSFALDHVRSRRNLNLGDLPEGHVAARRQVDSDLLEGRDAAAHFRASPHDHVKYLLLLVYFSNLCAFDKRHRRASDVPRSQTHP